MSIDAAVFASVNDDVGIERMMSVSNYVIE